MGTRLVLLQSFLQHGEFLNTVEDIIVFQLPDLTNTLR